MSSSIKNLALKETVIEAVQWLGSDSNLRLIQAWGADVRPSGKTLVLQAPDMTEAVSVGDWIIKTRQDDFLKYTDSEVKQSYAEVA